MIRYNVWNIHGAHWVYVEPVTDPVEAERKLKRAEDHQLQFRERDRFRYEIRQVKEKS